MNKKAYRVYEKTEDPDYGMGIVFAPTAREARLKAWNGELDIIADSYTDLRARRERWADAYAETGDIPIRAFLENGWWWTCYGEGCAARVDLEDIGGLTDHGDPLCQRCADKEEKLPPDWAVEWRREIHV